MRRRDVLHIALGILTSIGGFLDVGAIATAAQAGASFRFALIWPILVGTICVVFLVEMSGRLAAVAQRPLAAAIRERFGFHFFMVPLVTEIAIDFLVLAAEIGGVSLALELVTGIPFRWWAIPVGLAVWLLIWRGTFALIQDGTAFLGLVTIVFVIGAFLVKPPLGEVAAGMIPHTPSTNAPHYWFLAVSILGAVISPYLLYFYSSGAVEDRWDESKIGVNRVVALVGMGFGSLIAIGVLITSAMAGIRIERIEDAALMLTAIFGKAGLYLFAASLGIACFGAAVETSMAPAYVMAQGFGWEWGEDLKPVENARFASIYTIDILLASIFMSLGVDPLRLTMLTMALTAAILPVVIVPFLVVMNSEAYLGEHRNGRVSNAVVIFIVLLAAVLAAVSIPLEVIGG